MKRLFVALTAVLSLVPDACKDKDSGVPDAATTGLTTTATPPDAGSVDIMQCAACQLAATSAWTFEGIYADQTCTVPIAQAVVPACAKVPVGGQVQLTYVDEVGLRKAGTSAAVTVGAAMAPAAPRFRKNGKGCVPANESATLVTPTDCSDARICRSESGPLGCAACRTLANGCPDFEETRLYAAITDPGLKAAQGGGGGGNLAGLQRCCAAIAAEAKRLGAAPEAGVLMSAAAQCSALVAAAGPNGTAPEMSALKSMLAGRSIPGCTGL